MNALGNHLIIELYDCKAKILDQVVEIEKAMRRAAKIMNTTIIHSTFHHFSPYGISGVVVIQESHLTIHTWPEYAYAAVDFFTCGPVNKTDEAIDFLKEALGAKKVGTEELERGTIDEIGEVKFTVDELKKERAIQDRSKDKSRIKRQTWFTDKDENVAISIRHKGDLLFQKQSSIQLVEIYDTFDFGKMLALDHVIMCTEKDESGYHEMIVHVPMMLGRERVEKVLVIGGGDGGVIRELVKYEHIQKVVMVEIDDVVVEAVKRHMPQLSSAFEHPRVELIIDDGIVYTEKCEGAIFDLVIVDAPDPIGVAEGLFTKNFYENIHRILKPDGLMVTQSESPYYNDKVMANCVHCLRDIFGKNNAHCYLSFIPTYTSGMWSFTIASKKELNPINDIDEGFHRQFLEKQTLYYYNTAVHKGAFALPEFVKKQLQIS